MLVRNGWLIIAAALLGGTSSLYAKDPFAGRWTVTISAEETPGQGDIADTLVFAGKFSSEAFAKQGFAAVEYEMDARALGPAKFTANQSSEKAGKLKWTGTVVVNEITGNLTWTKKDGTVVNYTFKGSREVKGK